MYSDNKENQDVGGHNHSFENGNADSVGIVKEMRAALSRVVQRLSLSPSSTNDDYQTYYYGVYIPSEFSYQEDDDGESEGNYNVVMCTQNILTYLLLCACPCRGTSCLH